MKPTVKKFVGKVFSCEDARTSRNMASEVAPMATEGDPAPTEGVSDAASSDAAPMATETAPPSLPQKTDSGWDCVDKVGYPQKAPDGKWNPYTEKGASNGCPPPTVMSKICERQAEVTAFCKANKESEYVIFFCEYHGLEL